MGVHFSLQYKKSKSDYLKTDELVISVRYYFQGKKLNVSSGVKCRIKDWNDDWEKTIKREPILKSDSDWKERKIGS